MTQTWHIITGEYPPQPGGVSDYTAQLARGLVAAGDAVHVWAPPTDGVTPETAGVSVQRICGRFSPAALRRLGRALDEFPRPRRVFVQWVPHGFGWRSLNVALCAWLLYRAVRHRDRVELMIHEAFVRFEGSWKQRTAALVHRFMVVMLLRAATRVWHAIPLHEELLRPYALGRDLPFTWLPIPSNIAVVDDPASVAALRSRYAPAGERIVGHFGTYGQLVVGILKPALVNVLQRDPATVALLLGRGGDSFHAQLVAEHPELAQRLIAPGDLPADQVSRHLQVCDFMLQPYADGVSCRRTSAMAGLAHGRAVVTTAGRATEPFWSTTGCVALAPQGEGSTLVEETLRLLADEKQRHRLGTAGAALYQERFRMERAVTALRGVGGEQ